MKDGKRLITLETIREHLGDRAAEKLSAALRPTVDRETAEAARRYVSGVPGDRIRRLKDRAAFAAAMVQLVQTDLHIRRWALRLLSETGGRRIPSQDASSSRRKDSRNRTTRKPKRAA